MEIKYGNYIWKLYMEIIYGNYIWILVMLNEILSIPFHVPVCSASTPFMLSGSRPWEDKRHEHGAEGTMNATEKERKKSALILGYI